MPKIVPIVEGDGEIAAVPVLLYKVLHSQEVYDITVANPKNAHGKSNLLKSGGIEAFIRYALLEPDCAGILAILDADDDCPRELAASLATRVRTIGTTSPVAIVVAKRMFENWFLASLETVRADLPVPDDIESVSAKAFFDRNLPPGRAYKETSDQVGMTRLLDIETAMLPGRSRSFQRLVHAVEQLIDGIRAPEHQNAVTP